MRWFDDGFDPIGEFVSQWNQKVRRLRWSCIGFGILMVLAGILCLLFPSGLFLRLHGLRLNQLNRSTGHRRLLRHRRLNRSRRRLRFSLSLPKTIHIPVNRLGFHLSAERFLTIGGIKHRYRSGRFCRCGLRHFHSNRLRFRFLC